MRAISRSEAVSLIFISLLSACGIVNYSPSPPPAQFTTQPSETKEFLSFSYLPGRRKSLSEQRPMTEEERRGKGLAEEGQVIMDSFSRHLGFMKVVTTPIPPALGAHINIYQTRSALPSKWCQATFFSLYVLPCYEEELVFETHYDVYVDNKLKNVYRYEINRKGFYWIGVLPFFWINYFMDSYNDAFSATVYQFITDVKRDSVL
jgi:hypothetical protein